MIKNTDPLDTPPNTSNQEEVFPAKPLHKREKKFLSPESVLRRNRLQKTLLWLCETFPDAFSISNPKPLKTQILKDIFSSLPEKQDISRKSLREVLAVYVRKNAYLRSFHQSTHRVDLYGQPVQEIDSTHAIYSQELLDARKLKRLAKKKEAKEKQGEGI